MNPVPAQISRRLALLILLVSGLLVAAASSLDVVPMRWLAERMSSDGTLSSAYAREIERSQRWLGWALMLASPLTLLSPSGWRRRLEAVPPRIFYTVAGGLALTFAWLVQERLFDGVPHMTDAISHLFQARLFAGGRWFAPAPPCPDAFYQYHVFITSTGMWFTKYTPGHALLLAAGLWSGLFKWILPLCAAGVVMLLGRMVERYDRPLTARVFTVLLVFSPLALLLAGSFMSHYTAMLCSVAGLYAFLRSREAVLPWPGRGLGLLSGACLAYSALIRPHELAMLVMIVGLYFLTRPRADWRFLFRCLPWMLAGAVGPLLVWAAWNVHIYGHPLVLGYGYASRDVIHPAFQGRFGLGEGYTLRDALAVLVWNLDRSNRSITGWPVTWLFVPLAWLAGRHRSLILLATLGAAVVMGVYFFYDYRSEYEVRYYFGALPFLLYLVTRGLFKLAGPDAETWRARTVLALVGAFYLHAATFYWPQVMVPRYGAGFESMHADLDRRVQDLGLGRALVLLKTADNDLFFYSSGFIHNDPELKRDVIYARYQPKDLDCLVRAFPDRRPYVLTWGPGGSLDVRPLN